MDQSLGIFVSYSFRHMFNKIEMPISAIRQLYVQFSMTICTITPTVYSTHRSNFSYRHLYLLHSTLADCYMLLFNYTITSYIYIFVYYITLEFHYNPIEREFDKDG
jgi:hypothetical protein